MLPQHKTDIAHDLTQDGMVFRPESLSVRERKEMERACARLFSSDDGQKVLSYLQEMTFQRALGASLSEAHLRYIEGQRALIANILRMIDRGKNP